jgi:hypothetical protein
MRDVEQLLRETLADPRHRLEPGPAMYETVRQRARDRRRRAVRVAGAFTAVVVIAGVATGVRVNSGHGRAAQVAASPSITPAPSAGQATPLDLGPGTTSAIAVTSSSVFVARTQPDELVQLSTATLAVTKRATTYDAVDDMAVDSAAGDVWTWSSTQAASGSPDGTGSTIINEYATSNLVAKGPVEGMTQPGYVFSGAALDGELWLATSDGLWVLSSDRPGTMGAAKVANGSIFSVVADPVRHRILYGSAAGTGVATDSLGTVTVYEIDAKTRSTIAIGSALPIGKESIAIVGDQIWVGGYGSGSTPRLFHLDGSTLQPLPTTGLGPLELGPGAVVWPGASVVWVRSGGSEGLTCIDPQSGAVLEQWDAVQGPVLSVRGHAYAVSDGSLDQLTLAGDCTG